MTHRGSSQIPVTNERSHLWAYDGLSRLVDASFGTLNSGRTGMEAASGGATPPIELARSEAWDFDRLGNWAGDGPPGSAPTDPGDTLSGNIDGTGVDQTTTRTHVVDQFNAIEEKITDLGTGQSVQDFVYDASGNLVFDGLHWYRYDAWGRLCQVFPAGNLDEDDFETSPYALKGRLKSTAPTIDPDDSIVHLTYDALGRLIVKQSPWPGAPGEVRTEVYVHDGVRRIQEIWRQPATGNGAEGGQNQNNGPPTYVDITEREYVHSPGYVDEFVCEIDTGGTTDTFWWVLQDPNYNVVALVSDGDGSLSRGEVARQYSWSPYGQLLRADIYDTSAPTSRLGHQGLFHDRLDADILSEPMVAFSDQTVQNRNRTLLPWLGRFAQRDPNASWLGSLQSEASAGHPVGAGLSSPDPEAMFADGMSLHGYVGQNPLQRTDPMGLFVPGPSDFITGALEAVVSEYAANQDWDVQWAGDWTTGDDWHSRLDNGWIDMAILRGLYDAFWIGIPGTDIGFNPLDWLAARGNPRTPKSRFNTPWGVARYSRVIDWDGYRATVYSNPRGGRHLIMFDNGAVRKRVRVTPSNHAKEIRDANKAAGFKTTPKGWTWHHHWESGRMYLVPRELHRATGAGHIGRAQGWPPEVFRGR